MTNTDTILKNNNLDIKALLNNSKNILDIEINKLLATYDNPCPKLKAAVAYSLLNQGKCIRSALVYYTGQMFNANLELLKKAMLAVELIHTYSLVHDDLPAMDNSDLRRGMPTSHMKFDEATAILVGDALQALAFEQLSSININPEIQLEMIRILSKNSGINGMVGGQSLDINNTVKNLEDLNKLHNLKTGALITASILLGALSDTKNINNKKLLDSLAEYGKTIGLAFQIVDDILDIEQSTEVLGKPQNLDKTKEIPTYPELIGSIKIAKEEADNLINLSIKYLNSLANKFNILKDNVYPLQKITNYFFYRKN